MRKLSRTRSAALASEAVDADLTRVRSGRVPGATITSWPGSPDIDLGVFFARTPLGASVTSAAAGEVGSRPIDEFVSLSDGTKIDFVTVGR